MNAGAEVARGDLAAFFARRYTLAPENADRLFEDRVIA